MSSFEIGTRVFAKVDDQPEFLAMVVGVMPDTEGRVFYNLEAQNRQRYDGVPADRVRAGWA